MRNYLKIFVTLTFIISLCLPASASAAGIASVNVAAPSEAIDFGNQFTVNIDVQPNNAIAGAQFSLSFDPSLVTVSSITEGDFLSQDGASTYFMQGLVDNTAGTITGVAGAITSPGSSVSDSGTFAVITFTASSTQGNCPLTLSNVIVGDINGLPVSLDATHSQVYIGNDSSPPAVATNAASGITTTEATLNGNLTDKGNASTVSVSFEYGLTTSYGNTIEGVPATLTSNGTFSANITGLNPETQYHYRTKAIGDGISYGADQTFTTLSESGGEDDDSGGSSGGSIGGFFLPPTPGVTDVIPYIDFEGYFQQDTTVYSDDRNCYLFIPDNTLGLTNNEKPLWEIRMLTMNPQPELPSELEGIGLFYDFGPDDTTFNPPITVYFSYEDITLPEGTNEEDLVIIWIDKEGNLLPLESTVDTENKIVSAEISHFTPYGLVIPSATSDSFTISDFAISPSQIEVNQTTQISALITNTGILRRSFDINLEIDGEIVNTQTVTLDSGANETVTFSVTRSQVGTYDITIGDKSGKLTITEAQITTTTTTTPTTTTTTTQAIDPASTTTTPTSPDTNSNYDKPEILLSNILPNYDNKVNNQITSADISFWVGNLPTATELQSTLVVMFDGMIVEKIQGSPIMKSEAEEVISCNWEYTPAKGWETGIYSFHLELENSDGTIYTSDEMNLDTKTEGAVINWSILLIVISVALGISVIVVAIIMFRKHRMYFNVITPPDK